MSVLFLIKFFYIIPLGQAQHPKSRFFCNLIIHIYQNWDTYFYAFLNSPARVTCPAYLTHLDLLTKFYMVKEKSCLVITLLGCNFLGLRFKYSSRRPVLKYSQYFLFFIRILKHVSHLHHLTGKIMFVYTYILRGLEL